MSPPRRDWRLFRRNAQQEARALRHLYRKYGHIPTTTTFRWWEP